MADGIWTGHAERPVRASAAALASTTRRCATASRRSGSCSTPHDKLAIARALDALGVGRIEAGFPRVSPEDAEAVRADPRGRPRRGNLGVLARAARRRRRAARARRPARRDRVAALRRQARRLGARSRGGARADPQRGRATPPSTACTSRSSASTAPAPTSASSRRRTRPRARPAPPRRSSSTPSASPPPRRPPTSSAARASGSARTSRSTSTGTTTSGSPPRRRPRPSAPAHAGSTARSTAWASGPATPTCSRSGSPSTRSTASRRAPPRAGARGLRARPATLRLRARAVEAARRREPLHARIGAVASQFHDPPAIEPFAADLVGADRRIVLGKKSGIDNIRLKCEELGIDMPEDAQRELLPR